MFHTILYQPILNLFIWLYNVMPAHDFGLVIFTLTVLVRLVLYPLTAASIKAQRSMQEIQPKLEALKKEYPNDRQKQAEATMALYKEHKVNPLASCLPMLVQLPILFALFFVLRDAVNPAHSFAGDLYTFVLNPGTLNTVTFGGLDLAKPSIVLAILAGLAQWAQAKSLVRQQPPKNAGDGAKDESMAAMMNKQMLYFMPILTAIIGIRFPAGLTLYWFLSTGLMVAQQLFMNRATPKSDDTKNNKPDVIEGKIVS